MDLIASLQQKLKYSGDSGYTVNELIVQAGLPQTHFNRIKIRAFLKDEIVAGRVESKMSKRQSICGMRMVPVYVPVAKSKTKARKK